jgi:hypothetical protein
MIEKPRRMKFKPQECRATRICLEAREDCTKSGTRVARKQANIMAEDAILATTVSFSPLRALDDGSLPKKNTREMALSDLPTGQAQLIPLMYPLYLFLFWESSDFFGRRRCWVERCFCLRLSRHLSLCIARRPGSRDRNT